MKSKLMKKGSPLLILALLSLVVVGTGAAIVLYWTSGPISHEISVTVEGMDGVTIQVVNEVGTALIANYQGKVESTELGDYNYGFGSVPSIFNNAFILCYEDGNVPLDSGLVVEIVVDITGDQSELISYTATASWGMFYYNDVAVENQFGLTKKAGLTFVDDAITIPAADVSFMTYDDILPTVIFDASTYDEDANALIVELDWVDSRDISEWGDYVVNISITCSLLVDDGA